jgi:SAM-dependent methyltransferase
MFEPAWQAVADAAGVGERTSLLDIGCGDGGFCVFAAGRGAIVHGLDAEPDSVAQAMDAVAGGDFRLGLMETLPWPDASFDTVTAFNALQYALDPDLAAIEAARVTRIGGRVAICKWGPPAQNQFFSFLAAIGANGVRPDGLLGDDPLRNAIRDARLELLVTGEVPTPIEMADDDALAQSLSRAGIVPELGGVPELGTAAATDSVTSAAAPYRQADGTYRFDNRLTYWVLRRAW